MEKVGRKLAVVLCRVRNPLNIGAVARAMADLGFDDLRLVNEYAVPFETARSAVDAGPVIAEARVFATLSEAVADCSLVYGTTAMGERRLLHPVDLLRDAAVRVHEHAAVGSGLRSAMVFGSEKTGLSNEEMSLCHRLLTIPMAQTGVSMNLGQAVAVCLYELAREQPALRLLPEPREPAVGAQVDRFEQLLRDVLASSGYAERFSGNMDDANLHRLVRRLALDAEDVPVWLGMLRHILRGLER